MNVPLLDLRSQHAELEHELSDALISVARSGQYILGAKVEELEQQIAHYCGTRFGIGMSSGTDALLAALMALGVGRGDLVIMPTFSFFATAGVVARCGATPVFIDNDPKTYNVCPEALADWIDRHRDVVSRVKAIIPVHLYGQCADMEAILSIAQRYGIPVIEDAAQAIGATCPAKNGVAKAGSMGLCGCLSFFPTKNLGGMGDGGMVVTNDEAFANRLKIFRNHGADPKYYHKYIGGNFRLDALQAAILLVKLPHLEVWHGQRRQNAKRYNELFANSEHIEIPHLAYQPENHIYNQYIISIRDDRRNDLWEFLKKKEISCEVYYPVPFHLQECFSSLGHRRGDFPNSEFAADHTLALPIYPGLTPAMQHYVVDSIKEFFAQ